MNTSTHVEGACLCDRLAFRFELPSLWCAHCHCTACRRAHGSALVTWVGVSTEGFELTRSETLSWYASSEQGERGFCRNCGATTFFRSTRWPGEVHIARANIPGPIDRQPSGHVYYGAQPADWFPFHDELPHRP